MASYYKDKYGQVKITAEIHVPKHRCKKWAAIS